MGDWIGVCVCVCVCVIYERERETVVRVTLRFKGFFRSSGSDDRLCGLVVTVPGYRSRGLGSIPVATRFSGTGSSQPR
jgi:hypothetical protein